MNLKDNFIKTYKILINTGYLYQLWALV